jgi:hypothetical protein
VLPSLSIAPYDLATPTRIGKPVRLSALETLQTTLLDAQT